MSAPPEAKVLLATLGTHGDLNPFIAVALRLQKLGLEPVIATSAEYRLKVMAAGIAFHEMRPSLEQLRADLALDEAGMMRRAVADPAFAFRDVTFPYLRAAYEDAVRLLPGVALVLTSTLAFAARLAAEKHAVPWMGVALQPAMTLSAYDPPINPDAPRLSSVIRRLGPRVSEVAMHLAKSIATRWAAPLVAFRDELGLARGQGDPIFDAQYSPHGTLGLYSPVLGGLQPDHPRSLHITGFAFYDSDPEERAETRAALGAFLSSGTPPLVFALGSSAHFFAEDFFEVSMEAAEALGRRAVLVTGKDVSGRFATSPDVFACRYAAYSEVFPAGAVIVHQGGIGTVGQALRAGKPQLIVPFHGDQFDNAARGARLGAARVLQRRRYRRARVIAELERLLGDASYMTAAARVAEQVRTEHGADAAAAAVMAVLKTFG